jgi:hypothetical protein
MIAIVKIGVRYILSFILISSITNAEEALMSFFNSTQKVEIFSIQGVYAPCPDVLYKYLVSSKSEPVEWATSSVGHFLVVAAKNKISIYRVHVGGKTVVVPCRFSFKNGIVSDIKAIDEFHGFYVPKSVLNISSINLFNVDKYEAAPVSEK